MGKVQDAYLNIARREKTNVSITLVHGETVKGRIKSFDKFAVLLDSDGENVLVFKHAISKVQYPKKKPSQQEADTKQD
ncbi:MAG: RNA chaperone Hfq [Pyrinomonadaceae bacterium]|nr:RNA chaperone Hfq [Pyrinomonadaceae bacterium]MCX7639118.1 RNA chaperone Hfq [Pyrinomonadaceae bacterium]MDW8303661.1 RNA chaperone Hfq [Acidobacteriota bacterium]